MTELRELSTTRGGKQRTSTTLFTRLILQSMDTDIPGKVSQPFKPALVRKLIETEPSISKNDESHNKETRSNSTSTSAGKERVTQEALLAAGELLRLFVSEARERAAIEAECEKEGTFDDDNDNDGGNETIRIEQHHISKIAAELLMDFS